MLIKLLPIVIYENLPKRSHVYQGIDSKWENNLMNDFLANDISVIAAKQEDWVINLISLQISNFNSRNFFNEKLINLFLLIKKLFMQFSLNFLAHLISKHFQKRKENGLIFIAINYSRDYNVDMGTFMCCVTTNGMGSSLE